MKMKAIEKALKMVKPDCREEVIWSVNIALKDIFEKIEKWVDEVPRSSISFKELKKEELENG